jgi:glutathione S-transferase
VMNFYPILYSFRRCPYAMRGRMAIKKSGVVCELREVLLRKKPEAMTLASPKGTVPILQLSDEYVLDESIDIMRWALGIRDPDNWLEKIDEAKPLIDELDYVFKKALDCYKYFVRHPNHPQTYYRKKGEKFLIILEERLIAHRGQGLSNTRTTFSDIAVFPFVRQYAFVDKAWFDQTPYSLLKIWLTQHLESELFLSIMNKRKPWELGDEVIYMGTRPDG